MSEYCTTLRGFCPLGGGRPVVGFGEENGMANGLTSGKSHNPMKVMQNCSAASEPSLICLTAW